MEIIIPLLFLALIYYFLYSYFKRKINRPGFVILTTIFALFFVAGIMIGLFVGIYLGGNYYEDFLFNGLRGYEAVGQIGALIGGLLGAVCGILFILLRFKGDR